MKKENITESNNCYTSVVIFFSFKLMHRTNVIKETEGNLESVIVESLLL